MILLRNSILAANSYGMKFNPHDGTPNYGPYDSKVSVNGVSMILV